ncbi:Alcohol acetyltransferase, partial [Teratosphaeriaceae sp. CCFEE 6253]
MRSLRAAGLSERRSISSDVLGIYGTLVSCATYHTDHVVDDAAVHRSITIALKQCVSALPVLSTVVLEAETKKPQLAQVSSIDLREHLHQIGTGSGSDDYDDEEALRFLLKHAHNEPLAKHHVRPAWRVYVQPSTCASPAATGSGTMIRAAFNYSHALADGVSGLLFHKTFFEALRQTDDLPFNSEPVFNVRGRTPGLLPPLERAATLSISWSFLLRPLLEEYLPARFVRLLGLSTSATSDTWTGPQSRPGLPSPPELVTTTLATTSIPSTHLDGALAACRTRRVRLTGLLAVMVARALASALRARGVAASRYSAFVPINLRRCIPEAANDMANYVSCTNETVDVALQPGEKVTGSFSPNLTDADWITARKLTDRLSLLSNTLADQPIALLRYLSDMQEWSRKQATKKSDSSFELSNAGAFEPPSAATCRSESGWSVRDALFSQSANCLGPPFNVNVASTKGGPLAIVLTWWPGMLGVEDEDALMEE